MFLTYERTESKLISIKTSDVGRCRNIKSSKRRGARGSKSKSNLSKSRRKSNDDDEQ